MSIANFNPVLWTAGFLENLNPAHVHANFLNRDYEGEIKAAGDQVKISSIGRVTISDYTRNAGLGGTAATPTITAIVRPEIAEGSSLFLVVDQQKYFNVAVDDVDKKQQKPKLMDNIMQEAAFGMANTVDQFVNSTLQTGVAGTTDNTGNRLDARTIGVGAGDDDAYEMLVDLMVKLEEADVTGPNFWCVIPPWLKGMLLKDVRFTNYGTPENRGTLANGIIGNAAGFEIAVSNNLSGATSGTIAAAGGVYTVLAGVKTAATYAEQMNDVEAYRPQDGFNDAVKGLHVYGAKVTRPFALSSCAATQA
jgi:hypothetical protein